MEIHEEYKDIILHTTEIKLSIKDRIKVLLGKKIILKSRIYTKEECIIIHTETKVII